jgi:hypothetical protein
LELLASLDFYDFYKTDLTRPTAARLAKSLSVIINFAKSRDHSWQGFGQVVSKEVKRFLEFYGTLCNRYLF